MSQPPISEDQRVVAVGLLANALRKEANLRRQAEEADQTGSIIAASAARARHTAAARYAQGMLDLLAVLFNGGRHTANSCRDEATTLAGGPSPETDD